MKLEDRYELHYQAKDSMRWIRRWFNKTDLDVATFDEADAEVVAMRKDPKFLGCEFRITKVQRDAVFQAP